MAVMDFSKLYEARLYDSVALAANDAPFRWLRNCKSYVSYSSYSMGDIHAAHYYIIKFADEADAILFTLMWS